MEKTQFKGVIRSLQYSDYSISFVVDDLQIYYSDVGLELELGDTVLIEGVVNVYENPTIENTFDYKMYQRVRGINYKVDAETVNIIEKNTNIFNSFKSGIYNYFNSLSNNTYLKMFLLGDKDDVDNEVMKSYQVNGISHLFAISGMHIGIISSFLLMLCSRFKISLYFKYLFVFVCLLFYSFLLDTSASVVRSLLFFGLFSINKLFYFQVKAINVFIITLSIILIMNPWFLFDVGFQFSFSISFALLFVADRLKEINSKLKKMFFISLISFIASVPILVNNFYQINLLSVLFNLFFVPFVSMLVFPMSFVVLFLPFLMPIYSFLIFILEKTSLICGEIDWLVINIPKPNFVLLMLYFLVSF